MPKTIIFLIIGLFLGAGLGFIIAASTSMGSDHAVHGSNVHDHSAHDHGDGTHDHGAMIHLEGPVPELSIILHPDGRQSRNLEIRTTHFEFDAEAVNGPHIPGRGHAHVYVNGVKVARAYAPWVHLAALPIGTHEIRVTLNANNHSPLMARGEMLEVTETLIIE